MKKKVHHVKILARCGMPRHAAACCGMLQNPHQQLPESGAAACCGMLLPLVLACDFVFAISMCSFFLL